MKRVLLFILFFIVGCCAEAQTWHQVETPVGTTEYTGGNIVTVTAVDAANSAGGCYPASPYTVGAGSFGAIRWHFCNPVTEVQFNIDALQENDDVTILINGALYPLNDPTFVNLYDIRTTYTCGGATHESILLGTSTLIAPGGHLSGIHSNRGVIINPGVGINDVEIRSNGLYAGISTDFHFSGTIDSIPPITGPDHVCEGSSITLTHTITGGTWSSSNTAYATVGSSTGIVTGVLAGAVSITYTWGTGCYLVFPITVERTPTPIFGPLTTCVGQTTTLGNFTGSGGVEQ